MYNIVWMRLYHIWVTWDFLWFSNTKPAPSQHSCKDYVSAMHWRLSPPKVIRSVWLRGNHLKCLNTKVPWSLTALFPTPAVRRPVKAQSLGKQAAAPDVLPSMMVKPRPIHRILKGYFLTCFYHQNAVLTWLYHPNLGPPKRPKTSQD